MLRDSKVSVYRFDIIRKAINRLGNLELHDVSRRSDSYISPSNIHFYCFCSCFIPTRENYYKIPGHVIVLFLTIIVPLLTNVVPLLTILVPLLTILVLVFLIKVLQESHTEISQDLLPTKMR